MKVYRFNVHRFGKFFFTVTPKNGEDNARDAHEALSRQFEPKDGYEIFVHKVSTETQRLTWHFGEDA